MAVAIRVAVVERAIADFRVVVVGEAVAVVIESIADLGGIFVAVGVGVVAVVAGCKAICIGVGPAHGAVTVVVVWVFAVRLYGSWIKPCIGVVAVFGVGHKASWGLAGHLFYSRVPEPVVVCIGVPGASVDSIFIDLVVAVIVEPVADLRGPREYVWVVVVTLIGVAISIGIFYAWAGVLGVFFVDGVFSTAGDEEEKYECAHGISQRLSRRPFNHGNRTSDQWKAICWSSLANTLVLVSETTCLSST